MKKKELAKKEEEKNRKQAAKRKIQSYDRYQQVEEGNFWKERLKGTEPDEFQIDTRGSFASGKIGIPSTVPPPSRHLRSSNEISSRNSISPSPKRKKTDPSNGNPF